MLLGVSRYVRTHGPWDVFGDPERIVAPIHDLQHWTGDGVIAQAWQPEIRTIVERLAVPVVNVSQHMAEPAPVSVLADSRAIGRAGAEHLLARGFRSFAYCGFNGHAYSEIRAKAFLTAIEEAGFTSTRFDGDPPQAMRGTWHERQAELAAWAKSLARPIGVMCCNDVRARHLAQACLEGGVRIPEDLALVGADNDELVCEMSNPPLSSISPSAEQVGYEAARLLDGLMSGTRPPPASPIFVPPGGVVTRRSSDILAIADPTVADAVRFIHDHAAEPIGVEDVVAAVPASRRVLERRFRDTLDRTIGEEICNARIDRAKRLLIYSDVAAPDVATGCGFQYVQQFNAMFKRVTGLTPTAFRRQYRQR